MERKMKHRILGILVVVGLVIILLPLFQVGMENSAESSTVQAPPFPDQSIQTPAPPEQAQQPAPQDQDMSAPQPIPLQNPAQDSGMSQQPDDTVNSNSPAQSVPILPNEENATPAPISNTQSPNTSSNEAAPQANNEPNVNQPNVSLDMPKQISELTKVTENTVQADQTLSTAKPIVKKRSPKLASKKRAIPLNQPVDDDGLFKLKNSVWVIQLGSFKNKANAIRLVNKLRSSGYAAFIQQMASSTRVFVGPETKQHSARTLASQINSEMHIQGIVISYKPLAI